MTFYLITITITDEGFFDEELLLTFTNKNDFERKAKETLILQDTKIDELCKVNLRERKIVPITMELENGKIYFKEVK